MKIAFWGALAGMLVGCTLIYVENSKDTDIGVLNDSTPSFTPKLLP